MPTKLRLVPIVLFHALLVFVSLVIAWLLRFEFRLPNLTLMLSVAPILILYRLAGMGRYSLLHGYWKHTGIHDVLEMAKAIAAGSAALIITLRYWLDVREFPLSVYILEAILTSVIVLGIRVIVRLRDLRAKPAQRTGDRRRSQRVLIAGAGFAAQLLIQELQGSGGRW